MPRWLDGFRFGTAPPLGSWYTSRHSRVDAGQGRLGALQPEGRLDPGERPRRKHAGEARPIEGYLSHRGYEEQGASHWWRPLGCGTTPRDAHCPSLYGMDLLRRHRPHAGVL